MSITLIKKAKLFISLFFAAVFILFPFILYAQQVTVSGTITDENESPLPGVNIFVKGKAGGTISDIQGNYTINTDSRENVIVFSFVGYEEIEEVIGERNTINIQLNPEYSELDEVVVIGYGTQKKSDLTGSVVKVSTDDIQEIPVVNVAEALKGRAAGVVVKNNTGAPGRGPEIRIRGESSLDAGNDPLIIIDGMPGGNLNTLNFSDVESFEVLKDASATSIYGAAGANGVILVTTKRGTAEKNEMNFSAKTGVRVFPEFHDLLSGEQLYDYLKDIDFVNTNPVPFSDEYYVNWDSIALSTVD
ncbi:MAG: TonB-dependent receptor plug domain-containing protein, partial [Bacteroidales bacterium]